jgi:hypothetical protein
MVAMAISASGCASSHPTPRPLDAREQIETVCGNMRVRLATIYRQTTVLSGEPLSEPPAGRSFQRGARDAAAALDEAAEEVTHFMATTEQRARDEALIYALHSATADFRTLADEAHRSSHREPLTPRQERELEQYHRMRFSPSQERLLGRYNALEAGTVRDCLAALP